MYSIGRDALPMVNFTLTPLPPAALVEWFGPLLMMVSVPGCPGFESAVIRWLGGLDVGPEKRFVYVAPCHKRAVPPLHDSESNGARAVGRPYPSG